MATTGQVFYNKIVAQLAEKAGSRFLTGHDTQQIGRYFWAMLSDECKEQQRQESGKQAFWNFSTLIKNFLINGDLEAINSLYLSFNKNATNYFDTIEETYFKKLAYDIF